MSASVDNGTKHVLQESIHSIVESSASYYSLLKEYATTIPLASTSLERLEDMVKTHSPYAVEMYNTYGAPLVSHVDDTYITPTVEQLPIIREQVRDNIGHVKQNVHDNIQYFHQKLADNADQIKKMDPIPALWVNTPSFAEISNQVQEDHHMLVDKARNIYNELYLAEVIKQKALDTSVHLNQVHVAYDEFHGRIMEVLSTSADYALSMLNTAKAEYGWTISAVESNIDAAIVRLSTGSKQLSAALFEFFEKERLALFEYSRPFVAKFSNGQDTVSSEDDKQQQSTPTETATQEPQSDSENKGIQAAVQSVFNLNNIPLLSIDALDRYSPRVPVSVQQHPLYNNMISQLYTLSEKAKDYLPQALVLTPPSAQDITEDDDLDDLSDALGFTPLAFEQLSTFSNCSLPEVTTTLILSQGVSTPPFVTPTAEFTHDTTEVVDTTFTQHPQLNITDINDDESDSNSFSHTVVSASDPLNDDLTLMNNNNLLAPEERKKSQSSAKSKRLRTQK